MTDLTQQLQSNPPSNTRELDRLHVMQTYGRVPTCFVRGEGIYLWDDTGKQYLDFLSGLAVTSLGHAHPEVADAIAMQARTLLHTSNLYLTEHQPVAAQYIDELIGGGTHGAGGRTFFANSGAEANECAIKLARRYGQAHGGPGRFHIVSAYGSFHGRTLTTLAATGQPQKQETFQPLPEGFRQVEFLDIEALRSVLSDDRVCAVMLEAVQGEGGVIPAPVEYLQAVRELCNEREVLLIIDEVQTGLGRTGAWFGFQPARIVPDIVSMAKALGNGMPIGACWARSEVAEAFKPGDHATTFGGQPLATAAARTVLEVMRRENVPALAASAGKYLTSQLESIEHVQAVRGAGLLIAAQLVDGVVAKAVADACMDAGLVLNAVTPTALRLAPSLLVSNDEIDAAIIILEKVLSAS